MGYQPRITDTQNSKAVDKDIKLSDSGGLFLLIKVNGSKYWRLAYLSIMISSEKFGLIG